MRRLRKKTFTPLSLSVAICLALLTALVAMFGARSQAQKRDTRRPVMHLSLDERERRMAWTAVGAAADPPPSQPSIAWHANRSLPGNLVSMNVAPLASKPR